MLINFTNNDNRTPCLQSTPTSYNDNMALTTGMKHGLLMIFGVGFLMPVGVLSARFLKHRGGLWFRLHKTFQLAGLLFATAGFIMAVTNFNVFQDDTSSTSFHHGLLGVTVFTLLLLQPLVAWFRPEKNTVYAADAGPPSNSLQRTRWEWFHKGMGYIIWILSVVTILLGAKMEGTSWILGYLLGIGGAVALVYGLVWYDRFSYQPPNTEGVELVGG